MGRGSTRVDILATVTDLWHKRIHCLQGTVGAMVLITLGVLGRHMNYSAGRWVWCLTSGEILR